MATRIGDIEIIGDNDGVTIHNMNDDFDATYISYDDLHGVIEALAKINAIHDETPTTINLDRYEPYSPDEIEALTEILPSESRLNLDTFVTSRIPTRGAAMRLLATVQHLEQERLKRKAGEGENSDD